MGGRDIAFYSNKIRQKLTENQRVKHVNFACFENRISQQTSLPKHDIINDVGLPIIKMYTLMHRWKWGKMNASLRELTRAHYCYCYSRGIALFHIVMEHGVRPYLLHLEYFGANPYIPLSLFPVNADLCMCSSSRFSRHLFFVPMQQRLLHPAQVYLHNTQQKRFWINPLS